MNTKQTKHTPTPWTPRGGSSRDPIAIESAYEGGVVARVERVGGISGCGADNARLIAAAPNLLASLKDLIESCKEGDADDIANSVIFSESNIAKAEGLIK